MRIRYWKNTEEILTSSQSVVHEPEQMKGRWLTQQEGASLLAAEIGCGKGKFICDMAKAHPDTLFVGVEYVPTVLARAARKVRLLSEGPEPENIDAASRIRLIRADAIDLTKFFAEGEVDHLYLNFSDPWPKAKHAKRRLTCWNFLPVYAAVLKPDGDLSFKTDNDGLFAFSIESFRANGWKILEMTEDLHHSEYKEGNITTEYEENFLMNQKPIHYLRAVPVRESPAKA